MCDLFVFIACFIVAFVYSWKLTLILISTGVPSALILWGISRFLDPSIEGQKRELAEAAKHATAATTAIDLVKVYNSADHEAFEFISAIRRSAKYYSRQVLCNVGQMSYIKMWMIMLFVVGFYFAVVLVDKGDLTPGNALTTFYAALSAFKSIETLGPEWLVLAKGMTAAQMLKNVAEDRRGEQEGDGKDGWMKPGGCLGDIRMTNLSFAYPSNPSNTVLHPSDFHFPQGEVTFVVGKSGSGKSTLGNLLLRFYEPRTGRITVDGNSVTSLDLGWLRRNITLIQQSSILFNDTFFQNVAFGALDSENVDSEDLQKACTMALLQSTIAGMPDGLQTKLGSGGYRLSGGQQQRLALARAKLRDPPVLILDEITSGLDPVTRTMIMDAIRIWRQGKTTIIITHEVGCIEDDEYVYVMADGSIVQSGLRIEVAKEQSGLFASLLASADDVDAEDSSSEYDSEEDYYEDGDYLSDEEPIQEATLTRILRGTIINNHRGVSIGFIPRMSYITDHRDADDAWNPLSRPNSRGPISMGRPLSTARPLSIAQPPRPSTPDSYWGSAAHRRTPQSRNGSHANDQRRSMNILTQSGLGGAQGHRPKSPSARERRIMIEKPVAADVNTSMDSIDRFFLETLATKKDKKKGKVPKGHSLPSLTTILKTVWPTLDKQGKFQLILAILFCLVIAAANPIFSFIFANLVGAFWNAGGPGDAGSRWAGYLAIVAAVDGVSTFFGYLFMEKVAQKWVNSLRAEAIKRILHQPKEWFDKDNHSPQRITQCLDRNAEEMRKLVGMFVPIVLTVTVMIGTALVWALIIKWDLCLVALAGLPAALGAARVNAYLSNKWETISNSAATATSTIFAETFANIKVVRALTLEQYFSDKHKRSANSTYRLGYKRAAAVGAFYGFYSSMALYVTALVFYYGAQLLSRNEITVTDVIKIINLILFSLGTSVMALAAVPQIAASKATATQMLDYANLPYKTNEDGSDNEEKHIISSPLPVRMNNLRFSYPGARNMEVLRGVNLEITSGTCTAIVGSSGCGKSTIAALLLRLYDPLQPLGPPSLQNSPPPLPQSAFAKSRFPTLGLNKSKHRKVIDRERLKASISLPTPITEIGTPISSKLTTSPVLIKPFSPTNTTDLPTAIHPLTFQSLPPSSIYPRSLTNNISYVPQKPFLFPISITENIAYGLPDTSPLRSATNINSAAKSAGIHEFITSLPNGYDTLVGEGGQAVSGGQAQRLCIARALARKPGLLVLDEPTSALDAKGAEGVRRVVQELVAGDRSEMAVVVITHSKEMMRVADRVVMIDGGVVAEEGSYEELCRREGKFSKLVGWKAKRDGRRMRRSRRRARRALDGVMEDRGAMEGEVEEGWEEVFVRWEGLSRMLERGEGGKG